MAIEIEVKDVGNLGIREKLRGEFGNDVPYCGPSAYLFLYNFTCETSMVKFAPTSFSFDNCACDTVAPCGMSFSLKAKHLKLNTTWKQNIE